MLIQSATGINMKIYSNNRYRLDSEIYDRLIGQDVWVKVYDPCYSDYSWLRILDKDTDTNKYICNLVHDRAVSKEGVCPCSPTTYEAYLSNDYNFSVTSFWVVKPMEIISTEEFFKVIK